LNRGAHAGTVPPMPPWAGRIAIALGLACAACHGGPSDEDLDRWRAEANAANEEAARVHGRTDERDGWTLDVVGRVARPLQLTWREIETIPATEFDSRAHAEDRLRAHRPSRWRGVRIDAILDRARPAGDATEVTMVATDGFRATIRLEDARRYPIILAYECDGQPIARDAGGPLYAVFPIDDHPELAPIYDGHHWVFYVSHLVVDTEEPRVHVGGRTLDRAALEELPRASLVEVVGYRIRWPSEPVRIEGPLVRDVLRAAGVELRPGQHVRVIAHAAITRGGDRPTRIPAEDVLESDVILAMWRGEEREPIPGRAGGPVALGFPANVAAHLQSHDWLTFVDALEVE
jgi:hypothetical protein